MTRSDIRKTREKSITTNLSIGFIDVQTLAGGVVETGRPIYVVPRKAEAIFKRVLWTYHIEQDPGNFVVVFAIIQHRADDPSLETAEIALIQRSLFSVKQVWRSITAVGVVNTATTKDVDMEDLVISRRTNLQGDDDFQISPAYRSGSVVAVGQSGTLSVRETIFQTILRDDPTEWAGYTFEESAS